MSHRVTALYHDRDKARLAMGDLQSTGFPAERIQYAEGIAQGSGRLEIQARDLDQAIDVRAFLEQDGAGSVEIRSGTDEGPPDDKIPTVPAMP